MLKMLIGSGSEPPETALRWTPTAPADYVRLADVCIGWDLGMGWGWGLTQRGNLQRSAILDRRNVVYVLLIMSGRR